MIKTIAALLLSAAPVGADDLAIRAAVICDTLAQARATASGDIADGCLAGAPMPGQKYQFHDAQAILREIRPALGWCTGAPAMIHALAWIHSVTGEQKTGFAMTCEPFDVIAAPVPAGEPT